MAPVSRAASSAPAARALPKIEIRTLCSLQRFPSKLAPEKSLTIQQASMAVACLGGISTGKRIGRPVPLSSGADGNASLPCPSATRAWQMDGGNSEGLLGTIPIQMTTDIGHQVAS